MPLKTHKTASSVATLPRRVPVQARARARVERILDAAAAVFDAVGFEAATTDAIARRAGTAIGSLYQFFPNKTALFEAVAARVREASRSLFDALLAPELATMPLEQAVGLFIDAFHRQAMETPGARAVLRGAHVTSELVTAHSALHEEHAERLAALMLLRAPSLTPERARVCSLVTIYAVDGLLMRAARGDAEEARQIVEAAKQIAVSYLGRFDEVGRAGG